MKLNHSEVYSGSDRQGTAKIQQPERSGRVAATSKIAALLISAVSVAGCSDAIEYSRPTSAIGDGLVGEGDIGKILYGQDTAGDTSGASTDAGADSSQDVNAADASDSAIDTGIPEKNPCQQLDPSWKTQLAGEYLYSPPKFVGTDRATLEGVTKEQVIDLAHLINDKVITELCYAQETVDPLDPEGNAVRVCDTIDVMYNGEISLASEEVMINCRFADPLPQGPKFYPQYYNKIIGDRIGLSPNTAFDFLEDGMAVPLNIPAIYKWRVHEAVEENQSPAIESFFLTGGNQDPMYGTGDFKRRSKIWIAGR